MKSVAYAGLVLLLLALAALWLTREPGGSRKRPALPPGASSAPSPDPALHLFMPEAGSAPTQAARAAASSVATSRLDVAAGAGSASPLPLPKRDADALANEVVLRFFNNQDLRAFLAAAQQVGVRVLGTSAAGRAVRVRIDSAEQWERLMAVAPRPVDYAYNHRVHIPSPPEPPPAAAPPDVEYTGFGHGALAWLGAGERSASWGQGVTIALLDTRVGSHPSLAEARIRAMGESGGEAPGAGLHGTAVATLLVGAGGSVEGVAPAADVLSYAVLTDEGYGDTFTTASAVLDAVEQGASVISLSLGGAGDDPFLRSAVETAVERGALVVAASGNDARDGVMYPGAYPGVLTVSAVDAQGRHLYWANTGESVDLAAPGAGIVAGTEDGLVSFSGTSAAVPFVSGAAAAVLSESPQLRADEVADLLRRTSDDAGAPGRDEEYGAGILNLGRVEQRDREGIYDVAAGYPHLLPSGEGDPEVQVDVYAQNRGTELLPQVEVRYALDGGSGRERFRRVDPGQTVSFRIRVARALFERPGGVRVRVSTTAPGVTDADPGNNEVAAVMMLK